MSHIKTIAVSGGKGGVGKSNIALNLAVSLAQKRRNVILMDADLGLANLDILLGISVKNTIDDLLSGRCVLQDLLIEGPNGIKIVPASSGIQRMTQLNTLEHAALVNMFADLEQEVDYLIIDTAAGISDSVVHFIRAAQEILLVLCNEPTSLADAYALLKLMNTQYSVDRFHIVANMVKDLNEGRLLYNKLSKVSDRFLDVALEFTGAVPYDDSVRKSVKRQKPFVQAYPKCRATMAIAQLAMKVERWPVPSTPRGHLEFFVDRLVQRAAAV